MAKRSINEITQASREAWSRGDRALGAALDAERCRMIAASEKKSAAKRKPKSAKQAAARAAIIRLGYY